MHLQISRLWPHGERFPSMRYSAPLSPCPFTFKRCSVTPAHANTRGSLTQKRISIGLLPWRLTIRICMRKKISCSFYLRTWKNLNKNQLTSLLKLGWFFLRFPSRFMAILCFFFQLVSSLYGRMIERAKLFTVKPIQFLINRSPYKLLFRRLRSHADAHISSLVRDPGVREHLFAVNVLIT